MRQRKLLGNQKASATVIEITIALAIIFTILAMFFSAVNSLFYVHVRTDVDLQAKCQDLCEIIISNPGLTNTYYHSWEDDPVDTPARMGLGTTPTIAYGTFASPGSFNDPVYSIFEDALFGHLVSSCFLAGTQVLLSDGSSQAIEHVVVGDEVMSFDSTSNTYRPATVVRTLTHPPEDMSEYYLILNNCLAVTPNHLLFYNGAWIPFDTLTCNDIINGIPLVSIEKVYEQVWTYDLEIARTHSYLVNFGTYPLTVHNDDPEIDWYPWVATSKNPIDAYDPALENFQSFYNRYYTEYLYFEDDANNGGIYEVKGETNFPYPLLDGQKIDNLTRLDYESVKSVVGFSEDYQLYDFNITISSTYYAGTKVKSWGSHYEFADVVVSTSRNVLIYHPPFYANVAVDFSDYNHGFYEGGQITVRMFFAGAD